MPCPRKYRWEPRFVKARNHDGNFWRADRGAGDGDSGAFIRVAEDLGDITSRRASFNSCVVVDSGPGFCAHLGHSLGYPALPPFFS